MKRKLLGNSIEKFKYLGDDNCSEDSIKVKLFFLIQWILMGSITGIVVGAVGAVFYHAIVFVTKFRTNHDFIIFLLPFAGLFIVFMYRSCKDYEDRGTKFKEKVMSLQ